LFNKKGCKLFIVLRGNALASISYGVQVKGQVSFASLLVTRNKLSDSRKLIMRKVTLLFSSL